MKDRELQALELRKSGMTLKEVGAAFGGLTRERARQMILVAEQEVARREALATADANELARLDIWTTRTRNCLIIQLGCETIDDVCSFTARELLRCKNFGRTCLVEVEQALAKVGRRLASPASKKR